MGNGAILKSIGIAVLAAFMVLSASFSSQPAFAFTAGEIATNSCWIDAATGEPVPTGPIGWSPTGLSIHGSDNPDSHHVNRNGHTFVRVPCPPPAGAPVPAQPGPTAQPQPETGSSVPGFGFGFGLGGFGRGQDRNKDSGGRP